LASGLMLCALALACQVACMSLPHRSSTIRICLVSLLIGLSTTANFSFAFINSVLLFLFCLTVYRDRRPIDLPQVHRRLTHALACGLPAFLTVAILTGPTILSWNRGELSYGAKSLGEMLTSIWENSFYQPLGFLPHNDGVFSIVYHSTTIVVPIVCTVAAAVYIAFTAKRADVREDSDVRWRILFVITSCACPLR
jgi:hypothetical protein